jgi:homoserine dehydrogenase
MTAPAKIAIIGLGTIGTGVARLLLEQKERIARHAGRAIELAYVIDADTHRKRNFGLPPGLLTTDLSAVLDDPDVSVAVELVGGLEPARTIVLRLLESGKSVITANKALLAEHGRELFDKAREKGRSIAFEGAVAGGIPIIASINECLIANQIESIHAILNGTSNFILTQMEENGTDYGAALAEAQQRGYAEANPFMDVSGSDAAQKLAILSHLAFSAHVNWRDIPRTGIDIVTASDMQFAKELGYSIKLLAVAERVPEGLELHVSPTLVRLGTPLAEVRGAYNAIRVVGDAVGRVFFHGLGAGQMPTASAVVSDIVDTVLGRMAITFNTSKLWSDGRQALIQPRNPADVLGRYYLRFNVDDRPGVMADIAGILGKHKISIASLIQHESDDEAESRAVPLVIMTHSAPEGAMRDALQAIEVLSSVHPGTVRMRIRN